MRWGAQGTLGAPQHTQCCRHRTGPQTTVESSRDAYGEEGGGRFPLARKWGVLSPHQAWARCRVTYPGPLPFTPRNGSTPHRE